MVTNSRQIVACELLAAAQGVDFHRPLTTSEPLAVLHAAVRERVEFYTEDRYLAADINALGDLLLEGLCRSVVLESAPALLPSSR
jgi:histidine ammonia-lyase